MKSSRIFASLLALLVVAHAADARAQAQDAAQQKCLNAMTGALTAVAKAQQKQIALCLKAAATGGLPAGQTAEQCLTADTHAAAIRKDMAEAAKAGMTGTPGFILARTDPKDPKKAIGITMLKGAKPFEAFKAEIDAALKETP